MRKMMQWTIFSTLLAVNQLFAQETGAAKPTQVIVKEENRFMATVKGLFSDPLIWALVIGLIVLIGVFFWVRKRQAED